MQAEQEVHAQETDACKPALLSQGADRRKREGLAGRDRRDECMDQFHLGRAPGRCAERWWPIPGRADQVMEDARLPLTFALSASCWSS